MSHRVAHWQTAFRREFLEHLGNFRSLPCFRSSVTWVLKTVQTLLLQLFSWNGHSRPPTCSSKARTAWQFWSDGKTSEKLLQICMSLVWWCTPIDWIRIVGVGKWGQECKFASIKKSDFQKLASEKAAAWLSLSANTENSERFQ